MHRGTLDICVDMPWDAWIFLCSFNEYLLRLLNIVMLVGNLWQFLDIVMLLGYIWQFWDIVMLLGYLWYSS